MREASLFDDDAAKWIADLRRVTERRNELAHGTIRLQPIAGVLPQLRERDFDLEWVIWSRRSHQVQRLTMSQLRNDLYDAIGVFTGMLSYGDTLAKLAPRPVNFTVGCYICPPRPSGD
jgi:hypothetical protein